MIVRKSHTQPPVTAAMLGSILVLGFQTASATVDEDCEKDPHCEVVVVYGTQPSRTSFFDRPDYQVPDNTYVPPESPSMEEELEWDCGPLLAEFRLVLKQCKDNAKVAYLQCKIELAKRGALGLFHDLLKRCEKNEDAAIKQCAIDDERRRGTLPPACGQ